MPAGRLAARAYRQPIAGDSAELAALLRFYELGREEGGDFEVGIGCAWPRTARAWLVDIMKECWERADDIEPLGSAERARSISGAREGTSLVAPPSRIYPTIFIELRKGEVQPRRA